MKLDDFLIEIQKIAKLNGISTPFIVGGVPRDRILGIKSNTSDISDVDITTGDDSSNKLAFLIVKYYPESLFRTYDDGHCSIDLEGVQSLRKLM